MSLMRLILRCIFGPRIQYLPDSSRSGHTQISYSPSKIEGLLETSLWSMETILSLAKWTSIIWIWPISRAVFANPYSITFYIKTLLGSFMGYVILYCLRGICRAGNPQYLDFINLHHDTFETKSLNLNDELIKYTFAGQWLPVHVCQGNRDLITLPKRSTYFCTVFLPLSYFLAYTIGVKLAYPGTISFIQSATLSARLQARSNLRRKYGLKRIGLITRYNNFVDAVLVDRRGNEAQSGDILFICCEGNAGYPEIGTINVPLEIGHSVLGWNHPGFGSSSGLPFPYNEQASMESIMDYAINKLKFKPENIYLLGWSIGGYTVTWTAMNYPNIAGVILDATFDDIDELSKQVFPSIFYPLVLSTVRQHMDLNNFDQLKCYQGPIHIIRRSNDEIISTGPHKRREHNRGNFLLRELLRYRYPMLFGTIAEETLERYLAHSPVEQLKIFQDQDVSKVEISRKIREFQQSRVKANGFLKPFPCDFGKNMDSKMKVASLLYLCSKYFSESDGTHCSPLDPEVFSIPWSEVDE